MKDCGWVIEKRMGQGKWSFFAFIYGDPEAETINSKLDAFTKNWGIYGYEFRAVLFVRAGE